MPIETLTLPDAYYRLPAGKLVNAVTWLEMRAPPFAPEPAPLRLRPAETRDAADSRRLFIEIGTPWLWSRAYAKVEGRPPAESAPADLHFALDGEVRVGLVEFAGRGSIETEITWFGLSPGATGRGLGRRMMAAALALAWTPGTERVWLHTCNFDHPGALRFYLSCGFTPYATGFEVMDDPRLTGEMAREAAPQVPLIEPTAARSFPGG